MPIQRTCGNCKNFVRYKKWGTWRNGLCDVLDYNCKTDTPAQDCPKYRSKKYNRNSKLSEIDWHA